MVDCSTRPRGYLKTACAICYAKRARPDALFCRCAIAITSASCGENRLGPVDDAAGAYPIVLAHGFSGFDNIGPLDYFNGVAADLDAQGETVYTAEVDPYGSRASRRELGNLPTQQLATGGRWHHVLHQQRPRLRAT